MRTSNQSASSRPARAALWALVLSAAIPAWAGEPPAGSLAAGNTAFALKLYSELRATEGNLFFSPFSISSALGMTYAGARGNTATEMKSALHYPLEPADLPAAFQRLDRELVANARKAGQELAIANGLCLTGGNVSDGFKSLLEDNFDAELFAGGLDRINGWVKRKTEGKIAKILDQLDPNSVCVLLNAIYFKGTWASPFPKAATRDGPFQMAAGRQVVVPFMHRKTALPILRQPDFQATAIPYQGDRLSMVILLPDKVDGLGALEKQLTGGNLGQWLAGLDRAASGEVDLWLPKFKLETGCDLVAPCKALGINDAFDATGKADFTGMGWKQGELWISQIKHKAYVEVNEEGTEAAAATAVEMATRAAPQVSVFRADHPFLFLIRDHESGSILFLGRLAAPAGK